MQGRKQQAIAKNATVLEHTKAILSSKISNTCSDGETELSDLEHDHELTSLEGASEEKSTESNVLLVQINKQKELIESLQQQLQNKQTILMQWQLRKETWLLDTRPERFQLFVHHFYVLELLQLFFN